MTEDARLQAVVDGAPRRAITFFYYDDLAPAVAFYRDVLGLELAMDEPWCAMFEVNAGARLGLVNAAAGSQRPISGLNKGAILSLEVDDLAACLDRLKRRGAADAAAELVSGCGGRTEEFKIFDPGGYTVEFFHWARCPATAES
jgi:predicted enzyme related to lactoylglutathione lyase